MGGKFWLAFGKARTWTSLSDNLNYKKERGDDIGSRRLTSQKGWAGDRYQLISMDSPSNILQVMLSCFSNFDTISHNQPSVDST